MRSIFLSLAALTLIAGPAAGAGAQTTKARAMATTSAVPVAQLVNRVDIPYQRFTLPNGLRVLVHEDRKAPIVAVSVWYNVGSKDEPKGKTGFAHLFEHLMFNGSENAPGDFFDPLRTIGATDLNGTTWFDRTNYFETVPTPALERALFLEADRMGRLLGAVTQEKLTNQIGVVQNEKRQGDNEPYGLVEYAELEALFPEGHPYRHSTIGSMADLSAATLDTVKTWFRDKYGPNNAVLVLAGDVDVATARRLVEKENALLVDLRDRLEEHGARVLPRYAGVMDLAVLDPRADQDEAPRPLALAGDGGEVYRALTVRQRSRTLPEGLEARGWEPRTLWAIDVFADPESVARELADRLGVEPADETDETDDDVR